MNDPLQPKPESACSEPLTADVFLDAQVDSERERILVDALSGCGVTARVRIVPPVRESGPLTWIVLIALPLQGFLSVMGTKIAEDSYARLRTAIQRLIGHPRQPADQQGAGRPRPLVLQDGVTGLQIVIEPDLPGEAYGQLLGLDLSSFRLGPLHYDRAARRWRSELDEASHRDHERPGR
jgi:hypothetical protein